MIKKLEIAGVFYNQSIYSQIPIYKQVYIIFKKLGAYGNDMVQNKIAD